MVTSLNTGTPAREIGYQMSQYISARITAVAAGTTITQKIGKIPSGALITHVHSKVVTAFSGGTPLLTVGQLGDSGLDNLVLTIAETAGAELLQPLTTITQPLTADTEFWGSIAGAATAGDAYLTISFIKPIS